MIRFNPEFDKEITRIVNKFNAKISRLQAQNATHLPKIVDESLLRAKYVNRNLLKRELQQLEEFTRPGAEEVITSGAGIKKTRWEWDKIEKDRVYALKKVTHALNKEKYSMDSDLVSNLRARQNFLRTQAIRGKFGSAKRGSTKEREEMNIRTLVSNIEAELSRERKAVQFKENMMEMLQNAFSQAGMKQQTIEEIQAKINELSPEELYEAYNENTFIKNFVEAYHEFMNFDYSFSQGDKGEIKAVSTIDTMAEYSQQFKDNIFKVVDEKKHPYDLEITQDELME